MSDLAHVLKDILLVVLGSGTLLGALLYYRLNRRQKSAEAVKTEAQAQQIQAQADSLTVSALGGAIETLRAENARLVARMDSMQKELTGLHEQVTQVVNENAELRRQMGRVESENEVLRGRLMRMRIVLVDVLKGIRALVEQVCEAEMEPSYTIPADILEVLDEPGASGLIQVAKENNDGTR